MDIKSIIGLVIALILVVIALNPGILPLSAETVAKMQELKESHFLIERSGNITAAHILTLIGALALIWAIYTILKLIINATAKEGHSQTVAILATGLLRYLAVITAFIWGLSILGVNTGAVLAGAGIIGLIIGFGAQSLIEDIITGLFIIFERQYEVGDIIILDDFRGRVRSIGVRTTVIEDEGGNLKVVNNSDIRNFQNRSQNDSYAVVDAAVSYDTDITRLEKMIPDMLREMYNANQDLYLSKPEYMGVEELGDSAVLLRFRAKTKEENVFKAKRRLNRDIKVLFDAAGIEIPFPQIVVHKADR
ncbi:MAG: mechanosensitive ion channel family protein [Solobacterium sp.]|nr:mechanosensitive ion channel family protein [Solobacterium sp.]